MIPGCHPAPTHLATAVRDPIAPARPRWEAPPGSWRYPARRSARVRMTVSVLLAAGIHAATLLGFNHARHRPAPKKIEDDAIAVVLEMPQLKDLEEPEPTEGDSAPPETALSVPMLADVPAPIMPNSFVQPIDVQSLLPPTDLSQAKTMTIPDHIARGKKIGEGLGNIFNLADLDRAPEPTVQPSPVFPPGLKKEMTEASVKVEFVVNTDGRVVNAVVVDSTHHGFDEAALIGVSKWHFRPGMKAGRKVNTRMMVPILFKTFDSD